MDELKRLLDGLKPTALVSLNAFGGRSVVIPAATLRRLVAIEGAAVRYVGGVDRDAAHRALCEAVDRG